jgi:N-acetylmuramoyl-L-alanine amidase
MVAVRKLVLGAALAWAAAAAAQPAFTLELLSPRDDRPSTTREFVNLLGRTTPGAQVRVAGEAVAVFGTGIFARDRVPLVPGINQIRVAATSPDGQTLERTLEIERLEPPPGPAWPSDRLFIDGASLLPAEDSRVAPGEAVEVAVRATPGQRVEARLAGQKWQPLVEIAAPSGGPVGRYRALLYFLGVDDVDAAPVQVRITAPTWPRSAGPRQITALTAGAAGQWRNDPERLYAAGPEGADLLHGLHEVRLGGPYLAELPAGTLLRATGQQGGHLRVQLAPDTTAWVPMASVVPAEPATPAPHVSFSSLSVSGDATGDVVTIPLRAQVPYAVRAVADASGRQFIEVELFGSHHATTWVTHRASARVVREVTALQAGPERVVVRIVPHRARLWGWRVERSATGLRVAVRAAPVLAPDRTGGSSPLVGLRIALEAGHGSAANLGAVGATGVPEKDINRWSVDALKFELEAQGAKVVLVREGDDNPTLRERASRVTASDAQIFISVHANATDTSNGYLRASGAAMFYKHATGRDLAAAVQRRVLEQTGLADFGLVGNFNYAPIRLVTWMPAFLVEQAFVSHPGDEALLLDPKFRSVMVRAVRMGLEDFLRGR